MYYFFLIFLIITSSFNYINLEDTSLPYKCKNSDINREIEIGDEVTLCIHSIEKNIKIAYKLKVDKYSIITIKNGYDYLTKTQGDDSQTPGTDNSRLRNYHVIKTINHLQISNKKITDDLNQIIIGNKSKSDYLNKCKVLIDIFVSDKERYIGGIAVENKYMENNEASSQNVIANANDNYIEMIQVETKNSEDNQNSSSQNGSFSKKKKK